MLIGEQEYHGEARIPRTSMTIKAELSPRHSIITISFIISFISYASFLIKKNKAKNDEN